MRTTGGKILLLSAILLVGTAYVQAAVHTEVVEYTDGDKRLQGYLAYDEAIDTERPGVLVVHEWTGIGDYVRRRTEQLAELGYVAFAADIYGKGIRPETTAEASEQASIYRQDRQLMRSRANAGLDLLRDHPLSDPERLAAIGYCFGGGVVLELARSGADVAGVASFHGNLDTPDPEDAENILAKVLVLHGGADPYVPVEQVLDFQEEMREADVNWQMNIYGNAVHSFTNPASGDDPSQGAAYNAQADRRSWQALLMFFEEIFSEQ